MAETTEQVEAVDHVERAESALRFAAREGLDLEGRDGVGLRINFAQVHASLAIAEQLERLNDQLEKGAIEVMYGGSTV